MDLTPDQMKTVFKIRLSAGLVLIVCIAGLWKAPNDQYLLKGLCIIIGIACIIELIIAKTLAKKFGDVISMIPRGL